MPNSNITLPQIEALECAWIRVPGGATIRDRAERIEALEAARKAIPDAAREELKALWPAVFPQGGSDIETTMWRFVGGIDGWYLKADRELVIRCLYALQGSAREARPAPVPVPVRGASVPSPVRKGGNGKRVAARVQAALNTACLAVAFACGILIYFRILAPLAGS